MAVTSDSAAAAATLLAAVAAVVGIFLIGFHLSSRSYRRDASARSSWGASAAASSAVWEVVVEEEEERPPIVILGRAETNMGLDEASIAALPRRAVAEAGHCCAVCIEELAAGVTARALPWCGHVFHVECVDTWLRSQATCPLCRREVDDTVVAAFVDAARVAAFFRWLLRRRQAEGELHYRDIEMATMGSNGSGQVLIN